MNRNLKKMTVIFVLLSFAFMNKEVKAACGYENELQIYGPYATESMKETGVYASLTLAQGIQEQGLRNSNSNNMFGIKMSGIKTLPVVADQTTLAQEGAKCASKGGTWVKTKEYNSSGERYEAMACFKTYASPKDSFSDHGRWLLTTFANRNNFMAATDLMGQLKALVSNPSAKYATDPNYLCTLIKHINACDLTRFDTTSTGELSLDGCASVSDGKPSNESGIEHFDTTYKGDIKQGWIYQRFDYEEIYNVAINEYKIESNINEAIDEIFDRAKTVYYSTSGNISNSNSYVSIYGKTIGESLPDYVKNAMSNPLGSQACNQSSCFGYYSSGNCSTHSGVDLTSSTTSSILAVADGKIVNVIRNNQTCKPTFTSSGAKCAPGCTGNIVTVEHDINGEKWYTKYVHMASLESNIQNGSSISKGDKIGVIGTSGCSTGIHLHFEIIGPNSTLYNPEELLYGNCNLKSDCSSARMACGK